MGIVDVKSYYIETVDDIADRVRPLLGARAGGSIVVRARLRIESGQLDGLHGRSCTTWWPAYIACVWSKRHDSARLVS